MNDLFIFLFQGLKAIWQPESYFHCGCARYSNQPRANRSVLLAQISRKQCEPVKLDDPAGPHWLLQQGKESSKVYASQLVVCKFLRVRSKIQNRFLAEQCGRPWKKEIELDLLSYPLTNFGHPQVGPVMRGPTCQLKLPVAP